MDGAPFAGREQVGVRRAAPFALHGPIVGLERPNFPTRRESAHCVVLANLPGPGSSATVGSVPGGSMNTDDRETEAAPEAPTEAGAHDADAASIAAALALLSGAALAGCGGGGGSSSSPPPSGSNPPPAAPPPAPPPAPAPPVAKASTDV